MGFWKSILLGNESKCGNEKKQGLEKDGDIDTVDKSGAIMGHLFILNGP